MADFKFTNSPLSYNSLRLDIVLAEKGITSYETVPADLMTGSHKTPEFLAKSPFGNVPLYEESNGLVIYESRAIARYLALKYENVGPKLLPDFKQDPKAWAAVEQALQVEAMKFEAYASSLVFQKLLAPIIGAPQDQSQIDRCHKYLHQNLDVVDGILAKQKYMAGDAYTLADINWMPQVYILFFAGEGELFSSRKNLARWWDEVSAREAWKKALKPYDDMNRAMMEGMKEKFAAAAAA
ncbi:hypothetical protein H2201_009013 [Coniosporium apollinis]|uniref:glutathione transferase n=1 Tax=Coniosporium apollinis TaxID=61459 RepID=A0ABQ9NH97_9PEZI|nr:hypothetical protein H2201_009013 [Coniosporium apollinis]